MYISNGKSPHSGLLSFKGIASRDFGPVILHQSPAASNNDLCSKIFKLW
jgi:hypothetical protein